MNVVFRWQMPNRKRNCLRFKAIGGAAGFGRHGLNGLQLQDSLP
jgi:hypothetical protein